MLETPTSLTAFCKHHAKDCKMNRSFRGGSCKGRPMGALIRWLKIGKRLTQKQHKSAKLRLAKRKRENSRIFGASKPVLRDLFSKEKGYNPDTGEVASEPSISSDSDSSSS